MAERMIRDWTQSESVNDLTAEAEVFFTRLIMKADDYGNYVGHPKLLRAALYPLRDTMKDAKIDALIAECESVGVVKSYLVEGKRYLNIPNYGQRMRQMKGKYPAPDGNLPTNVRSPLTNAVEGKEGKGREVEIEKELTQKVTVFLKREKNPNTMDVTYMVKQWANIPDIMGQLKAMRSHYDLHGLTFPTKIETLTTSFMETDWIEKMKDSDPERKAERKLNAKLNGTGTELPAIAPANKPGALDI